MTPSTWLSRATASGVPPSRPMRSSSGCSSGGAWPPSSCTHARIASPAPLRRRVPSKSTPLIRVCGGERDEVRVELAQIVLADPVLLGEHDDRAALGRLVGQRRAAARPRPAPARTTPGMGMNAEAWRLPSVIVPVLSSSSTSTSPDASTARPESASTLRRTRRSMPAMPIADSSAPIVVGISATSSAISVVTEISVPRVQRERPQRHDHERGRSASARRAGSRARSRSASCAARRPRRGRSCGPGTTVRAPA